MCGVKPARRPELAAEAKYLTWTGDNLLRQVVYERLREDTPAAEVHREVPVGTGIQTKGLGMSLVCATKRLIAAWRSKNKRNRSFATNIGGRTGCTSDLCLSLAALCC